MAAETRVIITGEDRSKPAFTQAENSLESLERQSRELQGATRQTAAALGLTGNAAQETGDKFTTLGRQIFQSQEQAKKFGGVFRSLDGRLREANGRFVKGREAVQDWTQAASKASSGTGILTTSVGSLGNVLSGLAIAAVTHQLGRLSIESIQAAGSMEQLRHATTQVLGSASEAERRLEELVVVANFPGLNYQELVRFSNRLQVTGLTAEDTDKILLGIGQTIVSLGGTADTAALATEQLIQAFQLGKVDLRDFRTVIQQIPGFYRALGEVHGVSENIDGLREAFEATGGNMRDLVIPIFDRLNETMESPPADSYVRVMDELQNSAFLTSAAVGDLLLPTVLSAASGLTTFFESIRVGIKDVNQLPEPIQDIIMGAKDLYDGLLNAAEAIGNSVGPEIRELAASLATLLGGVLDLAGSIYDVLTPVWKIWGQVNATVIALITKLAQDITSLIGVLTDFVDWIGSAWREEDKFTESTNRVTEAIENVEKATSSATQSTQEYQSSLRTILEELQSVNTELEEKQAKLEELKEKGLTPADASMAQIVRRIGLLEERSKSLTGSLPDLNQVLEGVNSQLEQKNARLNEMIEDGEGASASAEHLSRSIATLTTLSTLLNAQIALTPPALTETADAADTTAKATENYGLTLARLKAEAEDARDTLSNTINFEQIGENYRSAIAASDAYYSRQIANAQEALSQAEANSDEYHKIETNIFNLQRERQEARKKITAEASAVARTEAEKRIEIANEEKERLQAAAEETTRALAASQKQQADAAEAEQKRLTQVHQENLKAREEADRASNERIVQDSEERLSALSNAFENSLPAGVDTAYENIQKATVSHYETLKSQARQRITDEDALNAELVSLDRQRNAALEDNHRNYIKRIADDAKNLLGERTESFKTASDDILHNWERTVSEFERQLREADTEDAIRAIEADFTSGQQNMLASLQAVLTELGFTADETAEIMKSIFRTAEGESDSFADKIISAFKRLGKEADRETKQQNRQIERNYRELVGEIEHILSNITDFFIEITRGGDIEDAFKQLGERVAGSFLDVFTRDVSKNLAASLTNLASETDVVSGAAVNRGGGAGGAGGAIQAAGGLTSILSLITSPIALAAIIPAAVGAATYYVGRQIAGNGTDEPVNRQGRPIRDDQPQRRRGESQAAYENRLQARAEAEAAIAERETFFGNYDPRAPFGRAIQETGIFTGDSGYFAESALRLTEVDLFGNIDLPSLVEDLEGILQTRVEGLGEDMERAAAALESASVAELKPALDAYFASTTDFYQTQIDFANFVRRTTGNLSFGDVEGLSRELQDALNQARLQDTSSNLTLFGIERNRREAQSFAESQGLDRDYTEQIARQQYGDEAYDAEVAGSLASVVESVNADVATINASITSIEAQINQASEPAEITGLLEQIPELIRTKYQRLRAALEAEFSAGEITLDAYNASLSELQSNESRELEQHSDAVLSNTLRGINEDVQLIDASISSIQTQIDGISEPEAIVGLLNQLPALITEKYQKLREALDEKYAAGEISVDVYNASLTALATTEASETERHSDAVLAQTLADIDDDVELIDANIGSLQLAVENSEDPEAIAGLLDAMKVLVMDKYASLRERLDELYAAEEISTDSYNASLTALGTAESRALADLDTQALNAISTEAQERVNFINGAIENLRLSLQLTDDPTETQRILEAIKVLVGARFDVLIDELKKVEDTLKPEQFKQALEGLELGKQVALENIDTEKFDAISAEAASQVDFINGGIENLRLALQLTDDPTEAQQIIDAIKVLTAARFQILRDELNAIKDTLKPEEFQQALKGINLGEQLALENLDTEKFDVISAAAEAQVDFINKDIELLRVSLELTDDPAQRQEIIEAIRVLTQARFGILRQELEGIRESLKPEEYDQALRGLNLGEQLSLENLDTEKFDEISAAAAEQVSFINKDIENLRLAFELADDPTERQAILDTIKILTRARFDILREELEAIRERLKPEEYEQALKGLNLSEALALENIDTEKFGVISQAAQKQVDFVNGAIGNLELALQLTDDPAEITAILTSIRTLTAKRFEILIAELKAIEESFDDPAEFAQALEGLQLGSQVALRGIDTRISEVGIGQIGIAIGAVDSEIQQLFDDLSEQTTASGIREAIARLRAAITSRFELERDRINQSADSEEEKARQLKALNTQESQQLSQLGERGISQFSSLVDTAQFLLDTATEAEFTTRRQELVDAINRFYDERTAFINNQDLSDTDRQNMLAVADIQRNIALQAIPQMHESVTERLEMEKRVQDQIQDLRDDSLDAEREHADEIVAINQRAEEKITDIKARAIEERLEAERRANRSREDIETDFSRDIEDILRGAGADESLFLHGDFQELVRLATIAPNQSFLQDRLSGLGLDLDAGQLDRIGELARERGRDLQDVDRDTQRRQQDIARRERDTLTRAEADRNSAIVLSNQRLAETQENLSTAIRELQGALTGGEGQSELIQKQSDAADKQSTAADKQTTAAGMQSEASTKLGETADAQSDNAITEAENAKLFQTAGKEHLQAAKELKDAARAQGLIEAAGALKAAASEIVKGMQDAFRGISALAEDFSEALGTIAAGRLEIALPEGFKPQTAAEDLSAIEERINASEPIPVNVVNPNEIAATPSLLALQGEIAQLRSEGLNNREIGQLLREDINALQESGVSRQDIRSAIRGEAMQRPLIEPVLGTPQTTPIASPPEPNALQAAGGASVSSVSITAQSVSVSGPIQGSLGQQSGDTVIRVENIIELDGDKVAENTENHIVTRRGEGRSLL